LVLLLIAFLLLATGEALRASDSKVPGGDEKIALKSHAYNGKLVFESEDGDFRWWFDSRVQFDGAYFFENKNEMSNSFVLRRVTFALKGHIFRDWEAEVDVDFGEATYPEANLDARDMFVKYRVPNTGLSFTAGNFKEPFGMERLNSSRLLTFLERSAPTNAFALGRRIGISGCYYNKYGQITVAAMGHELGTRLDKGQRDDGMSSNVRLTLAPINQLGKNLHLGFAYSSKNPETISDLAENTIEIKARTENYVFDPKQLHTGDITDVNYYDRYGLELMAIKGPFYFQSEGFSTNIHRWYDKPDVDLRGAYATVAWMLTGETRYYYIDEGEVGPTLKPNSKNGAVEVAARYSYTDLNDLGAGVHGGSSKQWMFGVNYYPNTNIKLQFNYSIVDLDEYATRKGNLFGDDDHSFVQMRIQASM
jgi:phosphate-selective porin OprO/OprP